MWFITTVLTLIFQAGVKELGEHYVTTCVLFHMIYQTHNSTPPLPPSTTTKPTSQDQGLGRQDAFRFAINLFSEMAFCSLQGFPDDIPNHKLLGTLCCFVASGRGFCISCPWWQEFGLILRTNRPSLVLLSGLLVQSKNLHLRCPPCAPCLFCLRVLFLFLTDSQVYCNTICQFLT